MAKFIAVFSSTRPEKRSNMPIDANLLIVDDTPANLRLLTDMLREQGYVVRGVRSGERALAVVEA
ncbi:MAG: hypothetical protein HOC74_07915, partial [Gemmatimonadetes bacterium]|nr:hypothetical protein [Gemmatimonadota bacterium]